MKSSSIKKSGSSKQKADERTKEIIEKYKKYVNPSLARLLILAVGNKVERQAKGALVWDALDKEYVDCLGGYGVFNVGHCHPKVIASVQEQLKRMPLSARTFFSAPLAELGELLAQITPGNLQYSFICNSGAEAVEGALKLARAYTRKPEIISTHNSFHGKTMGALSATGRDRYREPFKPLVPGFKFVPYGDATAMENLITSKTGAVILEPVQGEGGIVVPPDDYLPRVREICNRKKVLLILDEVQTGLGRTGKLFCCDYSHVTPDIIVLGKALSGGTVPIGAFIGSPEIWQPFFSHPLIHTSTFGGNPLACQAALASIEVLLEENLSEKAKHLGEYFFEELKRIQLKHPQTILHIRGKGLLIGIELAHEDLGGVIIREMFKKGIIVGFTFNNPKVIRLEPPLTITKKQIKKVIGALEESMVCASSLAGKLVKAATKFAKLSGLLRY